MRLLGFYLSGEFQGVLTLPLCKHIYKLPGGHNLQKSGSESDKQTTVKYQFQYSVGAIWLENSNEAYQDSEIRFVLEVCMIYKSLYFFLVITEFPKILFWKIMFICNSIYIFKHKSIVIDIVRFLVKNLEKKVLYDYDIPVDTNF